MRINIDDEFRLVPEDDGGWMLEIHVPTDIEPKTKKIVKAHWEKTGYRPQNLAHAIGIVMEYNLKRGDTVASLRQAIGIMAQIEERCLRNFGETIPLLPKKEAIVE